MRLPKYSFCRSLGALLLSVSLSLWSGVAEAKNPFLSAISDDRALATFSGTEWGDEIGRKELPFSARVVTTRIAKLAWGEVYQIAFESIRSQTGKPRTLQPLYFVTTDKEIFRLTADKPDEALAKLKGLSGPPKFEPSELYGLTAGSRTYKETGLTVAKVVVKGSRCLYTWNHNSGHFMTVEWQSGLGLTEIAQGRGARADGYRLRRGAGLGR
jgi:hypothetical protein